MNPEPHPPAQSQGPSQTPPVRRMFMHESGWKVALKVGSERMFCYMMAPGQDFYHRLLDGEVYVHQGDERICLACAARRGLLAFEARGLGGEALTYFGIDPTPDVASFDLTAPPDEADRS